VNLSILDHLDTLVRIDTQNPPRSFSPDHEVFDYLRHKLGKSFAFDVTDHGDGSVSMLATRGHTQRLFNFHLDTVPVCPGWETDPFGLRVLDGKAIGLGACDIKGASASMLTALEALPDAAVALLFTSDEEAGKSRCVREFLEHNTHYQSVVVAEPTEVMAVSEHRGIVTSHGVFAGKSAHAAYADADENSAVHHVVEWSAKAIEHAHSQRNQGRGTLRGLRFNLGRIEGGIKPNMIAATAEVRWGCRPPPAANMAELVDTFQSLTTRAQQAQWTTGFVAPSLPTGEEAHTRSNDARRLANSWGLRRGAPVDFWTEAALFSEAGMDAIVFGPGHIAQAHTAGEWVDVGQLVGVTSAYREMLQ
jgi:acetylornithine deacetylase